MPGVLSGMRIDSRRAEAEVIKVWHHLLDPISREEAIEYAEERIFAG